jgi:uncharacterized membrane protein YhaH (DUF805 family)
MNAWAWYLEAWRNYFNFKGRSSRPAYWYFCLVHLIVFSLFLIFDIVTPQLADVPIFAAYYSIVTFCPGLSAAVRRLHDRGLSGWLLLVGVVPVVGQLYLLYEVTMDSEPGDNQYGPKSMKISSGGVMPIIFAAWLLASVLFLAIEGWSSWREKAIDFTAVSVLILVVGGGIAMWHRRKCSEVSVASEDYGKKSS